MLSKPYKAFYKEITDYVPKERIYTDPIRTLAYGTDASFYRLTPQIVISAEKEQEVIWILRIASKRQLPVTFRAAGTSLSGQAVSDSILVRLGEGWQGYKIFDKAGKISLEPGVIGSWANCYLSQFGKKIGPDPASIDSAMIGGIVANNASGMCCGVSENSYKTIADIRIVLYDGTVLDTSDDSSKAAFARKHPEILREIGTLRGEVKRDEELSSRIRKKFKIKNTTGYSLNSLVDFEDPFEIIKHLMVGSEGTLAFISEVVYNTVVEHPHKASALMLFPNIESACEATVILKKNPVAAVELMDRASLRSVEAKPGIPEMIRGVADGVTALLVETRAGSEEELTNNIKTISSAVSKIPQVVEHTFTPVPEEFTKLWNVRKGLFPAVGAVRDPGTTVIIEDVAFPMDGLAQATLELQELFKKYEYNEAIIFGHALEGNLHFVFTQAFETQKEIDRYQQFMDDVAELVVTRYDGSLKAEHGTGRNMAPFVEMEWGETAYALMKKIKNIFDPMGILNPGVILNDDSLAHIKNLKPMPEADEIIDKCIECGFCEPICPSKHLTFTPRHRITSWRETCRLTREDPEGRDAKKMRKNYQYPGIDTCAVDGLCSSRCPVEINTGSFIKKLRAEQVSGWQIKSADIIADHFGKTALGIKAGLKTVHLAHKITGTDFLGATTRGLRTLSVGTLPQWNSSLPDSAGKINNFHGNPANPLKVVYFPACISRSFGSALSDARKENLPNVTMNLLGKCGYDIIFPEGLENLCCGMPFSSKGYVEQAAKKSRELELALNVATENGKYPVLVDTSPCLYQMKGSFTQDLKLYEPIEFILKFLKNRLRFYKRKQRIAIHPTCTTVKMRLHEKMVELASLCSHHVVVPDKINCCGFSGDRGFNFPELNASALKPLKDQVAGCSEGYSTSKTCEIGLSLHGDITYRSILYLVDRCTEPVIQTSEL